MKNRQKKLTPALELDCENLKTLLGKQAALVGDDPVENAQKMALLCSILMETNIVENEQDLLAFTDLRTAAAALEHLMERWKANDTDLTLP